MQRNMTDVCRRRCAVDGVELKIDIKMGNRHFRMEFKMVNEMENGSNELW
jgi:hypothetical protein